MFHTQGLVLKRNFYREFDDVFTVYTKDFGKIEVLGRGVKRPLAKLNSHLQIFDFSEIEFVLGKKFKVLTGASLIGNILDPESDQSAIRATIDFFDFIDQAINFDDSDGNIWGLLGEFFDFIKSGGPRDESRSKIFSNFFKFRLISLCGFEPILSDCASCHRKLNEEKLKFSLKNGGVVCGECDIQDSSVFSVLPSTVKFLRIFSGKDKDLLLKLRVSKREVDDLVRTMNYFVKWNIG